MKIIDETKEEKGKSSCLSRKTKVTVTNLTWEHSVCKHRIVP